MTRPRYFPGMGSVRLLGIPEGMWGEAGVPECVCGGGGWWVGMYTPARHGT